MLDDFRFKLGEDILRAILKEFYRRGFGAGYRYEDWAMISPEIAMARKRFDEIKEEISGLIDQDKSQELAVEQFLGKVEPKLQALTSQTEVEKIMERLRQTFAMKPGDGQQKEAGAVQDIDPSMRPAFLEENPEDSSHVQAQYEKRKKGEWKDVETDPSQVEGNFQPGLIQKLFSDSDEARQAASMILGEEQRDLLPDLFEAMEKAPIPLIKGVILRLLPGSNHQEKVYEFLGDEDPRILATTIEILEIIGDDRAYANIWSFISHPHNRVRANALKALHKLEKERVKELLKRMVHSRYSAYRDSAAYVLCSLADPIHLELVKVLLSDPEDSIRDKAFQAIQFMALQGNQEASRIVRENLDQLDLGI